MATKYTKVLLTGNIYWAKLFEFNREMTDHAGDLIKTKPAEDISDEDAGAYEVEVHLSKDEAAKLKKSGARQKPKTDKDTGFPLEFEDGYAYRFRRFHCVPRAPKAGGAPVVKIDGRAYDPDTDGLIGNGTQAKIELLVSSFPVTLAGGKQDIATRTVLQAVTILDLVKYERDDDTGADEPEAPAAKPEPKKPAPAKKAPARDLPDDEIPF